jgi:multicomponent Na+:H+ antiporter subunit C
MTSPLWYLLAGAALFCLGLGGVFVAQHLLRKLIALNIMASGVFLQLVSVAARNRLEEPDPVPHAMVLTGIVVALGASAFGTVLARRWFELTGRTRLSGDDAPAKTEGET